MKRKQKKYTFVAIALDAQNDMRWGQWESTSAEAKKFAKAMWDRNPTWNSLHVDNTTKEIALLEWNRDGKRWSE